MIANQTKEPETAADVHAELRAFARDIATRFRDPYSFPLSAQQQEDFIRWSYLQADRLVRSQGFLAAELDHVGQRFPRAADGT